MHTLKLEALLLFLLLPVALLFVKPLVIGFALLWVLTGIVLIAARKNRAAFMPLCSVSTVTARSLWQMVARWAVCSVLLWLYTAYYEPELLFKFPTEKPMLWIMVLCLYPFLSALPQEIVYRVFFFHRYAGVFKTEQGRVLANAAAFALIHLIFGNVLAVVLSFVGGVLFAYTYRTHQSLLLVWVEHTLYGWTLFTVGLGWYFYHGNV
jgi:hypothetical protein